MAKRDARRKRKGNARERRAPRELGPPGPELTALDQTAVALGEVVNSAYNFERRRVQPAVRLRKHFAERIGAGLAGREAAEAIEAYMGEVEAEMAARIARHSLFWWMYVSRRLPPDAVDEASLWTVGLYRRVLTLAILKYADAQPRGIEFKVIQVGGSNALVPLTFREPDGMDVFVLEYLASEYAAAAAAYRRVCKGATLSAPHDDYFDTPADEQSQELMTLLDERVSRYGSLTGPYGAAIVEDVDADATEAPLFLLQVMPNLARQDSEPLRRMFKVNFPGPSNFVPGWIDVEGFRRILVLFDAEIAQVTGVGADTIMATLWAMTMQLMGSLRRVPHVAAQVFRTGYMPIRTGEKFEEYVEDLAPWVRYWWENVRDEQITADSALQIARAGLQALTYDDQTRHDISLWDRIPARVVIPAGDAMLVDFTEVGVNLRDLFRAVGFLDGSPANVKAKNFEAEVVRRGREAGLVMWEHDKELIAPDGSKRDVDASFVIGQRLYVIECKAFSQHPRVDRGEYAALMTRGDTLDRYLTQAETLAQFVRDNPTGRNYAVPNVDDIEFCLCTPGVEWIRSRDPAYWLTEDVPRVCALDELLDFLTAEATA